MGLMIDVYTTLRRGAEGIAPKLEQVNKLNEELNSKMFSNAENQKKLLEMQAIKGEIRRDAEQCEDEANAQITAYIDKLRKANELRPEELNDDLKLLNAGVPLLESDIVAMLERNKNNRTMKTLIFRYAKEHDIPTGGYIDDSGLQGIPAAEGVRHTVRMFTDHWINTDKAIEMLNRFFEVKEA